MEIHVARSATQLGVFSLEEITAGLQDGRFFPTDNAWRAGMAAWVPLSQWAEFSSGIPAAPMDGGMPAAVASAVPWEQGKSVGSFFATIKLAITRPRETFAHARMEFSDWLIFAYIAELVALPFKLLAQYFSENPSAQLVHFLESINNPSLEPLVEALRQNAGQAKMPFFVAMKYIAPFIGLAVNPLLYAVYGVVIWLGFLIIRQRVTLNRSMTAMLMAYGCLAVLMAPLGLFGFNFAVLVGLWCLLVVPILIVYHRIHGAGVERSAWASFGVHALIFFLFCCCCVGGAGAVGFLVGVAR